MILPAYQGGIVAWRTLRWLFKHVNIKHVSIYILDNLSTCRLDESYHSESEFYYPDEMTNDKESTISVFRESTSPTTPAVGSLPTATGGTWGLGYSFFQYGPPGWWITYIYKNSSSPRSPQGVKMRDPGNEIGAGQKLQNR